MNLHNQIMNIPVNSNTISSEVGNPRDYKLGHRDARHAAAELSLKAEARIEELEEMLRTFVNWKANEEGTVSLVDDEELWKLAEQLLED